MTTEKTTDNFTVTLRPETYRRLEKLAEDCGQTMSEAADVFITDGLDEQDELELEERELCVTLGLCPDCGGEECEGDCLSTDEM